MIKITFLRFNNNGNIDKRKFPLRKSAKRGSYKNPYLRNGDLIFIGKSTLVKTNEVLKEITSPLQGKIQSYGFYKLIVD